jgi:PadR family transcriptional regulator PadR
MVGLGRLELSVLEAAARQGENAYAVSILDAISAAEKKNFSYGAIHVTLSRLVEKGFLKSKMGEPTAERGGRRKKFYELTGDGRQALWDAQSFYEARAAQLSGLAPLPAKG